MINPERTFEKKVLDMEATGNMLRIVRKSRNISIKDAAEYCQTTPQALYYWESGKNLNLDHLVNLCSLYDVSFNDIIKSKKIEANYYYVY